MEELLKGALIALGYSLYDLEISNHGRMFRIFIEKESEKSRLDGGIGLTDCEAASRHLQRVLEVENIDYERLEVSSPGLDRKLKSAENFERFKGHEVDVQFRALVQGRRHIVGVVDSVVGNEIGLKVGAESFRFAISDLKRARLVPKI